MDTQPLRLNRHGALDSVCLRKASTQPDWIRKLTAAETSRATSSEYRRGAQRGLGGAPRLSSSSGL